MKDRSLRSLPLSVASCQLSAIPAAALLLAASLGAHAYVPQAAAVPEQDEEKWATAAQDLTEHVCSECHDLGMATDTRRAAKDWNTVVVTMASKGANAKDEEFATIKKYLTRYYGLVNVNTATAEELSAVLGLTAKDAVAIVEHRQANGKFADVEALAKVPGIDKAKIEAQVEALKF
jgi:competence ComEA-like helix-hairpin-helix protein